MPQGLGEEFVPFNVAEMDEIGRALSFELGGRYLRHCKLFHACRTTCAGPPIGNPPKLTNDKSASEMTRFRMRKIRFLHNVAVRCPSFSRILFKTTDAEWQEDMSRNSR